MESASIEMLCSGSTLNAFASMYNRDNPPFNIDPDFAFHHSQVILGLEIQPELGFHPKIPL
jgi:hypothetical protein